MEVILHLFCFQLASLPGEEFACLSALFPRNFPFQWTVGTIFGNFKTSERLSNRIRSNRNKTNGAKFNSLSSTVFVMFLSDISAEIGTQSVLRSRSVPKTNLLSRSEMSGDCFCLFVCFSQDVVSFVTDYLHYQVSPWLFTLLCNRFLENIMSAVAFKQVNK